MNTFPLPAAHFVGEDSCLSEIFIDNGQNYFPPTWRDWTPGLEDRTKWAWKYYNYNAVTIQEKTPIEFAKYLLGAFLEPILGKWYWLDLSHRGTFLGKLLRQYFYDVESMRKVKLVWSRS